MAIGRDDIPSLANSVEFDEEDMAEDKMWTESDTELVITVPCIAVGLALGNFAAKTYRNFKTRYSAFLKIKKAKSSSIADLHTLLSSSSSNEPELFVVRGLVQPKVESDVFVHRRSGQSCVAMEETHGDMTCDYLQGFFKTMSLRAIQPGIIDKSCKYKTFTSVKTIPFILTDIGSDRTMSVSLVDSSHSLLLTRVFHQLEDIYEIFSCEMPYAVIVEYMKPFGLIEKMILPVGKEITAIGICRLQNGNTHIKACQEIPYFLSDKTRDEMLTELKDEQQKWLYCTPVLGSLSLGILGYILTWNWRRWKRRNQQHRVEKEGSPDEKFEEPDLSIRNKLLKFLSLSG